MARAGPLQPPGASLVRLFARSFRSSRGFRPLRAAPAASRAAADPALRRPRAVRREFRTAGLGGPRHGAVGCAPPGAGEAVRSHHRRGDDRRGRRGAAAVDTAAAASGPRHRLERLRGRPGHGRHAGRAARHARAVGADRADGRRGRPQRAGHRPVHRRPVRAGSAGRSDDGAARADGPVDPAAADLHRGRGRGGRIPPRRHGRRGHRPVRAGHRPAGAALPAAVRRPGLASGRHRRRRRYPRRAILRR